MEKECDVLKQKSNVENTMNIMIQYKKSECRKRKVAI